MIKASDAIRAARQLIGTPYAELDCINLIKKVIRDAPGGVKGYTTAGTNTLWRSADAAAKYRDLTWRQEGLTGAQAGMIAFKADGEDWHHAGIVTGEGTVIHSSSTQGGRGVVETPLTAKEGWTHLAKHRYIETAASSSVSPEEESEGSKVTSYKAVVRLNNPKSTLNVRNEPGPGGDAIGEIAHGQSVTVQVEYANGWAFVAYGDKSSGYVSMDYLAMAAEEPEENVITVSDDVIIIDRDDVIIIDRDDVIIIDSAGNTFKPVGSWRVLRGGVD